MVVDCIVGQWEIDKLGNSVWRFGAYMVWLMGSVARGGCGLVVAKPDRWCGVCRVIVDVAAGWS